jgi:two-component system, cell cycle sensor histidine kinase and response regulator CckA
MHDLNNLLAVVMLNVELARRDLRADRDPSARLDKIEHAVSRAKLLCSQLPANTSHSTTTPRDLCLDLVVGEMVQVMRSAVANRASLHVLLGRAPPVCGDCSQLQQVVLNLFANALEAIDGERGRISIETGACRLAGEEAAFVRIEDNGRGLDEAVRKRMFDPFFSTKAPSRGLGLAATDGIVRVHGGSIRVESEPGRGTRFEVILPATPRTLGAPTDIGFTQQRQATALRRNIVLVADDVAVVREAISSSLQVAGYATVEADDGAMAVKLARRYRDALAAIVLDVTMPHVGGVEALRVLRLEHEIFTPAILISGYSFEGATLAMDELQPMTMLGKPFLIEDLLAAIDAAVGSADPAG